MIKIKIVCAKCKKEFEDYKSNHRKYCSRKCAKHTLFQKGKATRKGIKHTKKTKKKISVSKKGQGAGSKNPAWIGGRIKSSGYILIYSPNHPNRNKDKYVYEHRLIMEKHLNRYLTKKEHVHHKNGISDDNRIKNLGLLTESEHHKIHVPKSKNGRFICNK